MKNQINSLKGGSNYNDVLYDRNFKENLDDFV